MDPKNITSHQKELLEKLQSGTENFIYEWDEARGALAFCRADKLRNASAGATSENNDRGEQTFAAFMEMYDQTLWS